MKESKFIELLNLYIDQQISPADAELMENEILRNPHRRRVYTQYCRMQRACCLVFENSGAPAGTGGKPLDFGDPRPRRRLPGWVTYAAGMATAAGLAFAAVQIWIRPANVSPDVRPQAVALVPPGGPAVAAVRPVRMDATGPRSGAFRTVTFVAQHLQPLLSTRGPGAAQWVGSEPSADPAHLQLLATSAPATSLRPSIEQFVFQADTSPSANPQAFRSRQPGDDSEQQTAYQFQR
jgi:hypothetical protein